MAVPTHLHSRRSDVFWGEIAPSEHLVQIYERDEVFLDTLEGFAGGGLRAGDAVIIIATRAHRDALRARLDAQGLDVERAIATDEYIALDAEETLAQFMVGGWPDDARFEAMVAGLLMRAQAHRRRVRAFGEMVALLWADGNANGAIELERLWNDLARRQTFSLLCGYPMQAFAGAEHRHGFSAVTAAHASVAPTETYLELDPDERLRAVAELQQRVAALEAELAARS
jgi:hypothetical protein